MQVSTEQKHNLPFLYTEAEKIDKEKALEIGASYVKLEILFTEACDQLRAIVEENNES
jgi:hypothetical protein